MTAVRTTDAKAFTKDVFIDQERRLGEPRRLDTSVVLAVNDGGPG